MFPKIILAIGAVLAVILGLYKGIKKNMPPGSIPTPTSSAIQGFLPEAESFASPARSAMPSILPSPSVSVISTPAPTLAPSVVPTPKPTLKPTPRLTPKPSPSPMYSSTPTPAPSVSNLPPPPPPPPPGL